MTNGALHEVSMSYQLLWNAQRKLAGVQLCLAPRAPTHVDARPMLKQIDQLWQTGAAPLQLCTLSAELLAELLDVTPSALARIEVSDELLQDTGIAQRVLRASQRGLGLIWRGEPGTHVKAAFISCFVQNIFSLSTEEALMALRIAKRSQGISAGADPASPVQAGQIYEGIASRMLAEHVLGQQNAAAMLGWPAEDVLYGYRQSRIGLDRAAMLRLIKAIEADAAMEDIEQLLGQEPLLTYRFLRYVNSAGAGLRREVDALRQGLLVLGLTRLKSWLHEHLLQASSDRNLRPVHTVMALRARLMASLLDAGEGDALRRELYLCGLLSQIDQLLAEPLASALGAVPLPERVNAALLSQEGPYWPYLAIATALEGPDATVSDALCSRYELDSEEVNLTLIRTLAATT